MIVKPDFLIVGGLVKVNGYVGRILEIAESDNCLMVKVESAKGVRRFQRPDWLEYTVAPDLWGQPPYRTCSTTPRKRNVLP